MKWSGLKNDFVVVVVLVLVLVFVLVGQFLKIDVFRQDFSMVKFGVF